MLKTVFLKSLQQAGILKNWKQEMDNSFQSGKEMGERAAEDRMDNKLGEIKREEYNDGYKRGYEAAKQELAADTVRQYDIAYSEGFNKGVQVGEEKAVAPEPCPLRRTCNKLASVKRD